MSLNIEQDMGGLLFANDRGGSNPDYNGTIKVNGKLYDIALWAKDFKGGNQGFTVKLSEPYDSGGGESRPATKAAPKGITPRAKPSRR